MKKILLSLFLFSAFVAVAQAQPVAVDDTQAALPVSEETLSAPSDNADGLDPDFREEFTLRLKRRYKTMPQKELEKRKKYVERQINRKAASKNTSLKERLEIELEVINDTIEQLKHPAVQE